MFGIDFYPSPRPVIERMLAAVPVTGKTVLEPSAGHGAIVDYLNESGAKKVLACEIDSRLRKILSGKCDIIGHDFLEITALDVSHIDIIVMNPPFSKQEQHIMHAWEIAPAGCQIISLCNNTMLENRYSRQRTDIGKLVQGYGRSENFGDCFTQAERKTGVEIGCIWLHKPGTAENEFDGYFDLYDYEQDAVNQSGIVRYDFVQDIVSRYVEAVSLFDEVDAANKRINQTIKGVVEGFRISFGARMAGRENEYKEIDRQTFKKELQKAAWRRLFGMMKMDKYVTTGVMADVNKFIEQQEHVPFTVRNVYLMVQMIVGTHGQRMDRVLVEAFEKICDLSYENSSAGEGWRTNTDFTINKRFIMPYMTESGWGGGFRIHYSRGEKLNDIVKALCYLTGKRFEDQIDILSYFNSGYRVKCNGKWCASYDAFDSTADGYRIKSYLQACLKNGDDAMICKIDREWGTWVDWNEFFIVKAFKKGTIHIEFKDEAVWLKFNQRVAEIKGWKNMVTHSKKGRTKKGGKK